jgi:hypothetical protein
MPPRLSDYELNDWLHARPLTHALKTRRYRATDRAYSQTPARIAPPDGLVASLRDRRVLVTIAFNDPQTIEWQVRLVRLYVEDVVHIIADNSRDDAKAALIRDVAAREGVAYLRLPANPWNEPSRSHGLALNWVWRNLIRPGAPEAFGLIDHDLYPLAPTDPFAALREQDWFGVVRPDGPPPGVAPVDYVPQRWFLWAGFSMFKFAAVKDKPIDFSQDWFLRLDTGGANWEVLYRHADRAQLREQETLFAPYREGLTMEEAPIQWCGDWLHEVGVMGRAEFTDDKRRVIGELLRPHLARAQSIAR